MPRVSRFRITQTSLDELTNHYKTLVSKLHSPDYVTSFFNEFHTPEEKTMLAKRLALFMLIRKGYTSQEIKTMLHVSRETIRTYQREMQNKSKAFLGIIDYLLKREENTVFLKKLAKALNSLDKPFELALSAKSSMKARAKLLSGDLS